MKWYWKKSRTALKNLTLDYISYDCRKICVSCYFHWGVALGFSALVGAQRTVKLFNVIITHSVEWTEHLLFLRIRSVTSYFGTDAIPLLIPRATLREKQACAALFPEIKNHEKVTKFFLGNRLGNLCNPDFLWGCDSTVHTYLLKLSPIRRNA